MIAFDLDGTLVDSRRDLWRSVNLVRTALGQSSLSFDETWPHLCRGMPHLYAHCFPDIAEGDAALRTHFEGIYLANIFESTSIFSGIPDLLKDLNKRVPLAVVTNKPQLATEALLKAANLSQFFAVIVGGDRCEAAKPSPIPLEFAYAQSAKDLPLVMVGDSNGDVRCGDSAGAQTIWCRWGYWDEAPYGASATVEEPHEILAFLAAEDYFTP